LHARDPKDGRPTQDPELFRQFLPRIRSACDVIVNITTGGSQTMTVDERMQPALRLTPELASLNMGTMNFGLYEMLPRQTSWRHEWEPEYLAASEAGMFKNTLKDIAEILRLCGPNGTRFELECYDIGHLYTAAHFLDRGLLTPPLFIQSVFGIRGGIGTHPDDVAYMKQAADRLFGGSYEWSVVGAGRHQMTIARLAASLGGHVRVGLEDSVWIDKGQLAVSNVQQVEKVRGVLGGLGLEIATPAEARKILALRT
jgi:uncharacterized protein (DUF849 family)